MRMHEHQEKDPRPGRTLRLVWPQWQGAGSSSVAAEAAEFPFEVARRGYAIGSTILDALIPPADGPSATVSVPLDGSGLETRDGVEAKTTVTAQLSEALEKISQAHPDRILTLGGDCAVSVAPFSALADTYGEDLAIVWIDSHPDVGTPQSEYPGYHAMAVSALLGHGDRDIVSLLPATVDSARLALVGLHAWTDDDFPRIGEWGLTSFSPDDLRDSSARLLEWLEDTGCSKVAIHFDVDTIDSNEQVYGLGAEPDGLTSEQVRRITGDLESVAEVVGFTVAEFIPRQVMHLQQVLKGLPLLG
ncbi:arginase family protein [Actinomycetaceae bacterium L2_0104]